jgi:predicted DCC family thiol-disulfide oxidoreductase YuxK
MLVLWDRDCGFCAWTVSLLTRWDTGSRLRTAPIQGPEGRRWLAGMPAAQRLASWHAVDDAGHRYSGGAAITAVLGQLRGARALARLTAAMPGPTERAYRWVARNRRLLSKPIPARAKQGRTGCRIDLAP